MKQVLKEHFIEERNEKYTIFNGGKSLNFINSSSPSLIIDDNSERLAGGFDPKLKFKRQCKRKVSKSTKILKKK